jgi:uncharacterized protein
MLVRIQGTETAAGAPPAYHLFHTESGAHLYVANGSRVYSVDAETAEALAGWPDAARLERLGIAGDPYIADRPLANPPVRTLSPAVAQKCNLGCVYCYAQQGTFGDSRATWMKPWRPNRSTSCCRRRRRRKTAAGVHGR